MVTSSQRLRDPLPGLEDEAAPIRVLHVDDDPDFADLTAMYLERENGRLHVLTETDGDAALDRLADDDVDCVVSDYDMPGMDGLTLLDAVRERYPELPFVLFTGKGSEEVASDAVSAGVTDYLQKGGAERYELLCNRVVRAVSRRRAETNYREVFEKATDGIAIHDPETGAFAGVNRRFTEMVGYDREELLGASVAKVSADDLADPGREAARRIRRAITDGPQVFEWIGERKNGDRFHVEVHLKRTTIGGQERVLASVRDISARKRRERDLERRTRTLDAIVSNVPIVLFELDADGVFTHAVGEELQVLDLEPSEMVGRSVFEVYEDVPAVCDAARRALGGESTTRTHAVDGVTVDVWYEPLSDDAGAVDRVVGTAVHLDAN